MNSSHSKYVTGYWLIDFDCPEEYFTSPSWSKKTSTGLMIHAKKAPKMPLGVDKNQG